MVALDVGLASEDAEFPPPLLHVAVARIVEVILIEEATKSGNDGVVLPLNLLGIPGDSPDFVVSAQVFSFIFTLRGDKNWKQPPATSGAISVSPLGLQIHQALTEYLQRRLEREREMFIPVFLSPPF